MAGSLAAKSTRPEIFYTDLLNKPSLFPKELVYFLKKLIVLPIKSQFCLTFFSKNMSCGSKTSGE